METIDPNDREPASKVLLRRYSRENERESSQIYTIDVTYTVCDTSEETAAIRRLPSALYSVRTTIVKNSQEEDPRTRFFAGLPANFPSHLVNWH